MNWTWLGLAVLVLLAFSMADGYKTGRSGNCDGRICD